MQDNDWENDPIILAIQRPRVPFFVISMPQLVAIASYLRLDVAGWRLVRSSDKSRGGLHSSFHRTVGTFIAFFQSVVTHEWLW